MDETVYAERDKYFLVAINKTIVGIRTIVQLTCTVKSKR